MNKLEEQDRRSLVRARARLELAPIDFNREVVRTVSHASQTQVAAHIGLTQARVSQIVSTTPKPREGFSGASPREIAQRFAAGELTEAQAIDELGRWPYREIGHPDEHDGLWEPGEGTWLDVELAHSDELITDEVYEGAQLLRHSRRDPA